MPALAAGIAAVVVFLVLRVKYGGLKGLYSKAIAKLLLPAYGALRSGVNPVTRCMPGSSCSVLCSVSRATYGDLKMIYEKDMEKFLNAGFIAFMIGHMFYIGAIYKFAGNWERAHGCPCRS